MSIHTLYSIGLVLAEAFFAFVFFFILLSLAVRLYWAFKAKRMKGQDLPRLDGKFSKFKRGKGLIYFYSPTCKPCQAMKPIIDKLSRDPKLKVLKVDVSQDTETPRIFGVMATPSTVLVKNGKIVDVLIGPATENEIRKRLSS